MGKYSYFKADFNRAETAQAFTHLPNGSHVVRIAVPMATTDNNGTYILWPLVARVDGQVVNAQFRQYLNDRSYPFIKRNLKALMGENYDLFDIEYLDEWLDWLGGAYAVVEVARTAADNGKTYVNYTFTGLHKPIEKPFPTPKAQTSFDANNFTEVQDDELPF